MCMENVKRAQHQHSTKKDYRENIQKCTHESFHFCYQNESIVVECVQRFIPQQMRMNFYMIFSSSLHISLLHILASFTIHFVCINTTHIQYSVTPLKITSLNSFFILFLFFSLSLVDSPLSFLDYVSGALGRIKRTMLNSLSFPHANIMHQHIFQTVYLTVDDCRGLLDSFFVYQ